MLSSCFQPHVHILSVHLVKHVRTPSSMSPPTHPSPKSSSWTWIWLKWTRAECVSCQISSNTNWTSCWSPSWSLNLSNHTDSLVYLCLFVRMKIERTKSRSCCCCCCCCLLPNVACIFTFQGCVLSLHTLMTSTTVQHPLSTLSSLKLPVVTLIPVFRHWHRYNSNTHTTNWTAISLVTVTFAQSVD